MGKLGRMGPLWPLGQAGDSTGVTQASVPAKTSNHWLLLLVRKISET
ncbi:MAG: hypothetical protein ABSG81_03960 [Acidimicrobiales bacterium]|jgi:hypothetical protein